LQESKLGDFEFQSIKLLAFRRAVVDATAAVVRFSSSPLSLFSLTLFPLAPFSLYLPLVPPAALFFPRILFASNGSFAAEIHTDVSPTLLRTPHLSFSSFLPRHSSSPPLVPFLFPPFCRGSSSATHESARIHTRVRSRVFSGRSRTHAEHGAP